MEGRAFVGFEGAAFLPRDGTDLSDLANNVSESSEDSNEEEKEFHKLWRFLFS